MTDIDPQEEVKKFAELTAATAYDILEPWLHNKKDIKYARTMTALRLRQYAGVVLAETHPESFAQMVKELDAIQKAAQALIAKLAEEQGVKEADEFECVLTARLANELGFRFVEEEVETAEPIIAETPKPDFVATPEAALPVNAALTPEQEEAYVLTGDGTDGPELLDVSDGPE